MRPNIWLPLIVSCWGTVTTLTGLVQSFGGLVGVRAVLGLCEGGLLPGMVLYLSTLYPRHELQVRIALFYAGAALSGAFGEYWPLNFNPGRFLHFGGGGRGKKEEEKK